MMPGPYVWRSRMSGLGIPNKSPSSLLGILSSTLKQPRSQFFGSTIGIGKRDDAFSKDEGDRMLMQEASNNYYDSSSLPFRRLQYTRNGTFRNYMLFPSYMISRFKDYEKCLDRDEITILRNVYAIYLNRQSKLAYAKSRLRHSIGSNYEMARPDVLIRKGSGDETSLEKMISGTKSRDRGYQFPNLNNRNGLGKLFDVGSDYDPGRLRVMKKSRILKVYQPYVESCERAFVQAKLCSVG